MQHYKNSLTSLYHERVSSFENPDKFITFDDINKLLGEYPDRDSMFSSNIFNIYPEDKNIEFITYRAEFKQALEYILDNKLDDEPCLLAVDELYGLIEQLVNNIYYLYLGDFCSVNLIEKSTHNLYLLNVALFGFINYINSIK